MVALTCPHCSGVAVIRYGKNASGTPRYLCKPCDRAFVERPKSRALSTETEERIVRSLAA